MLVYILIFGLSVICAVLLLWYFDPLNREGFQAVKNTYEIVTPTDYSGIGSEIQVPATNTLLAQEACNAAPGCTQFLYYAGIAYLTISNTNARKRTAKSTVNNGLYNTGTDDIINTLVAGNLRQTFTINAKRRYVRVSPNPSSTGFIGISQVVVLDHNGNNIGVGKSAYSPTTFGGTPEAAIDADTSTIVNSSYTNRVSGSPMIIWHNSRRVDGYWEVDLGDIVNISSVTIYYKGDDPSNIGGTSVVVSNTSADRGGKLNRWKSFGSLPEQGEFILMTPAIDQTITVNYSGRYVRIMPSLITSAGGDGKLSISSIIVRDNDSNDVSIGKPTYITNLDTGSQPVANLVSGSTAQTSFVLTAGNRLTDYIEIDLGSFVNITTIRIIGGSNSSTTDRQTGTRIKISSTTDSAPKAAYSTAVQYRVNNITVPTFTSPAPKVSTPTPASSFWNLVNKVNTDDSETLTALTKVKDPDPNDPNDTMPLSFSKYISIYALSQYSGHKWEVINNQEVKGSDIAQISGTVDQGKAACIATPGCTQFANFRGINYIKSITATSAPMTALQGCTTYLHTSDTGKNWDVIENQCTSGSDISQMTGSVVEGKAACIATAGCTEFAHSQGVNYIKKITPKSAGIKPLQNCTTYRYTSDVSGARSSLFNNYDVLQRKLSNDVYSPPPAGTDPKVKSCSNLEMAKTDYMAQYNAIIKSNQDLSGQAIMAGAMREENLAYQTVNLASCKGANPSPACISLADQEAPVFSLLANYDNVNNTMASSGFYDLSNNIDVINTAYAFLGCSGSARIQFSPNDTGTIDTQTLMSKLNQMSPYYLSPDTLQYITSSIISSSYTNTSLMADADKLDNISKVINNLKAITGTS